MLILLCVLLGCQSENVEQKSAPNVSNQTSSSQVTSPKQAPRNSPEVGQPANRPPMPPPSQNRPHQPKSGKAMAMMLWSTMSIQSYMKKVHRARGTYQPILNSRDKTKPLVVILGSSSSGGDSVLHNPTMQFWPLVLQKELPQAHVQSIAWGGATSWHMKKLLSQLNLRPKVCIMYMGHNDRQSQSPRQSLASLEKGEKPSSNGFVPWISLPEAASNIQTMAKRCEHFVAIPEYKLTDPHGLHKAYAQMLKETAKGNIHYTDMSIPFKKHPINEVMGADIYPTDKGHQVIAEYLAGFIKQWL